MVVARYWAERTVGCYYLVGPELGKMKRLRSWKVEMVAQKCVCVCVLNTNKL